MIINDIVIILKLLIFALYSTLETIVKNVLIPHSFMKKSIKNQVVLITGAGGNIGNHLVRSMLAQSCKVVCIDCDQQKLDCLEEELRDTLPNYSQKVVMYERVDVTRTEQIAACAQKIKDKIKQPVDILINNAGIFNKGKLLVELTETEILNIFNVNILGQIWLTKQFLPDMISRNKGHIVNISSSLGQFGAYRCTDYCTTKFAVAGFTEALRIELKSSTIPTNNIKVTLVCPYHVNNDFFKGFEMDSFNWANVHKNDPQKVVEDITNGILLDKELIGFPKVQFYLFLSVKNFLTTHTTDAMMMWFGFNEGIERTKEKFSEKSCDKLVE